ncbi:hypothetical protein K466DRAFT_455048, partial [Polyporus arcularius HHB13444]
DIFAYRGRHFGRAIHAFINVSQLITNGGIIVASISSGSLTEEELSAEERQERMIFEAMLSVIPELEEGLRNNTFTPKRLLEVGNSIQRGAAASRGDDVKGIKTAVVDWITHKEHGLVPPIPRNQMGGRGFNHDVTGRLLCPAGLDWSKYPIRRCRERLANKALTVKGDQWPLFLYLNQKYDPHNPWEGFLLGKIVFQGFKHIFTSPSSVTDGTKATRSGNARLHGMMEVTPASIVYTATVVRFALGSSSTFTRSDTVTDSELFYNSLYSFVTHPDENERLAELLESWNKAVFPGSVKSYNAPTENSALARLLADRK